METKPTQSQTLYKRTATGAIQEWTIYNHDGRYWSISGQIGGKKVVAKPSICKPKNVGKKNATTADQQAALEAKAKWQKKVDEGYVDDPDKIDTSNVTRVNPMLAKDYKVYADKLGFPLYSQPKLDGLRCVITREGTFSRKWKPFVTVPHVAARLQVLLNKYPNIVAFDGELYSHELKNEFEDIVSIVKQPKATPEDIARCEELVQYHIYDYVDTDKTKSFKDRITDLYSYLREIYAIKEGTIRFVPTHVSATQEALDNRREEYLEAGYEGQMVRVPCSVYENTRTDTLLKRKDFQDDEFEIVGYKQGKGSREGCICLRVKTKEGKEFDSVPKGKVPYLKRLWEAREELVGMMATVKYQNLSQDGIPRFNNTIKFRDKNLEEVVF